MTFEVLDEKAWRHDVIARPLAMLDVTPTELAKALGAPLIQDESDFVPRYLAVVGLGGGEAQVGFEYYEGSPKRGFVVTDIGAGRMSVERLCSIFGFPAKRWTALDPGEFEPTPAELALEKWHRAKRDQLANKRQANEALLELKATGLSVRAIARLLRLSPTRIQQLLTEAEDEPGRIPEHRVEAQQRPGGKRWAYVVHAPGRRPVVSRYLWASPESAEKAGKAELVSR